MRILQPSPLLLKVARALTLVLLPQFCYSQSYSCSLIPAATSTNDSATTNDVCDQARPWQFNKVCEIGRRDGSCTDCLDCDPCRQWSGAGCVPCTQQSGCVWCPGDAMCSSFSILAEDWQQWGEEAELGDDLQPSCLTEDDWRTSCSSNGDSTSSSSGKDNIFSDPLFDSMKWIYDMIRVTPVWEAGITGAGVRIRVNDVGGVDVAHVEFDDRFDRAASCEDYAPTDVVAEIQQQQVELSRISQHGTGVASLALGGANNDQCSVGIAPKAILSACTLPAVGNPFIYATIIATKVEKMDISVNAWTIDSCVATFNEVRRQRRKRRERDLQQRQEERDLQETITPGCPFLTEYSTSPCNRCNTEELQAMDDFSEMSSICQDAIINHCVTKFEEDVDACSEYLALYAACDYDSYLTESERLALESGILAGRNGKGIIFVVSAGNGYVLGDSTNNQKWINTRYTISVGAVDKKGLHASYSAVGASLFLSAPGGDLNHVSNNWVASNGGGCHDVGAGTSFSAPVVAGALGLLLEINPGLTWRDIQGILAETSEHAEAIGFGDAENESWTKNAAGYHHSYQYGFGILDVEAAVAAAQSWDLWDEERSLEQSSGDINLLIPAASEESTATTTLVIATDLEDFQTESVTILLQLEHPSRGDLSIVLTSPSGTESIMHFSPRPENTHSSRWSFWEMMTVRNWGESPIGEWRLGIRDGRPGNLEDGCVDIPWTFILGATEEIPAGAKVTCNSIRRTGTCANGALVNEDLVFLLDAQSSQPPNDACCVCGGGMAPSDTAQLVSWSMYVYGRGKEPPTGDENVDTDSSADSSTATRRTTLALTSILLGVTGFFHGQHNIGRE